jgi:hypothetical protein
MMFMPRRFPRLHAANLRMGMRAATHHTPGGMMFMPRRFPRLHAANLCMGMRAGIS